MERIDNDEFRRRVQQPAALLRRVGNHAHRLGEEHGWTPADTSVGAREWQQYSPHPSYSAIFTGLHVAQDFMNATADIMAGNRISIWASMPLGRATVEVAARAWWLGDPDLTAEVRIARGYELWRISIGETRRLPDFPDDQRSDLHRQLEARLRQHDVDHEVTGGLVTNVVGAHWPGAGEVLAELYGDASYAARIYMWMSGVAHGDPWIVSEPFVGEDAPEEGRRLLNTRVDTGLVAAQARAMVVALVRSVDRWAALMGWDDKWTRWSRYYPRRADEILDELRGDVED